MFFDGLSDFEKGAVFCAMDSANEKSEMRPSVKLMLKYYKNGHFDKEGFLKKFALLCRMQVMKKSLNMPTKPSLKSCAGVGWKRVANQ